jgi:flagellar L-ring protein FlgH
MMNQPILGFGIKKIYPRVPECVGCSDGHPADVFSRTTCDPRPLRFSALKMGYLYLVMTGLLWGCAAPIKQVQPMTEQQQSPQYIAAEMSQPAAEGSLWQENGIMGELFINPKARRVGDIVTIKIVESSKASNNASTNSGRDSSLSLGLTNFLGLENNYTSNQWMNPFGKIAGSGTTKFTGAGGTSRSGDLNADITTRVVGVLPSGNLAISGSRQIIVNNETQLIVVSGVIRSRDISSENVVLSTFISDAKISYSGSGIVNDQQRKGWLSNLIDVVSPF